MHIENTDNGPHNELSQQFGFYDPSSELLDYKYPSLDLLEVHNAGTPVDADALEVGRTKIIETFFYSQIELIKINAVVGPTLTLYEFIPAPGVRVSKIRSLQADLELNLAAEINIIGPIPVRGSMGIEIRHKNPHIVSIGSVLAADKFKSCTFDLPIAMGRSMSNEVFIADLSKLPHLLIAGATGQGKSVCLNAILFSLLYKKHPSQLKFVLIDINGLELSLFSKLKKHFLAKLPGDVSAIITDKSTAINTLNSLVIELDQRYDLMKSAEARNIEEYNRKFIRREINPLNNHCYLPFIVVMIDEFADLLTEDRSIELIISRLTQLGRAAGIHLIISTQRPSVDIITGTIKANFTSRLAFRVSSNIDSRTILDTSGAETLNGYGDMLLSTGVDIIHLQGAFVTITEVTRLCEFIESQRGYPEPFHLPRIGITTAASPELYELDSLFDEAARLVVMYQQGSTSLIQRKLKLGYNRSGRIIDQMEAIGIIGPFEGSKAREVLVSNEYELEQLLDKLRTNKQEISKWEKFKNLFS